MLALISAPSNLGLRPPQPGAVPGTAKAPEALREAGLYARFAALGAADAGVVLAALLAALAPHATGAQVTVFDPDLDPGGRCAGLLTSVLTTGLQHLGDSRAQPRP